MRELPRLRRRGLQKTTELWPALQKVYALVQEAAHLLANHEEQSGPVVRAGDEAFLLKMGEQQASLGPLSGAITKFLKVTKSSWAGWLQCYDIADRPRTDHELEHGFGSLRYGERRASGRRGALAGVVVRGPVGLVTARARRRPCFLPRALYLKDPVRRVVHVA